MSNRLQIATDIQMISWIWGDFFDIIEDIRITTNLYPNLLQIMIKKFFRKIIEWILKQMAIAVLRSRQPEIIGITGSVGKSSTKEAIFSVLKEKFSGKIWKNEGNLNEEIGVPLTILGFKRPVRWFEWPFVLIIALPRFIAYRLSLIAYPQILVLEFAANKPGDIKYLTSFVKPKIGIITAIGLAHTEFFGNLDNIIKEKGILVEILPRDGWAILNQDDPEVRKMALRTKAQVVYYQGGGFDSDKKAARAIGEIYHLSEAEIKQGLAGYRTLPHRMDILEGIKGTTIIDDCYNANPLSMERALAQLRAKSLELRAKRRIAVLGDMLELGRFAKEEHKKIAEKARQIADLLVTVGPNFAKTKSDYCFEGSRRAADFLLKEIKEDDIILIKGSRGMRMEKIVETLIATNNNTNHH